MSLKAKLEAVIYAAEEPVTLTQLASLFAAEALEWKAAQAAAAAEQTAEVAATPADGEPPLMDAGLEYLGLENSPQSEDQAAAETSAHAEQESQSGDNTPSQGDLQDTAPDAATPDNIAPAVDAEADARRQARQRDREVKSILKHLLDELVAESVADSRGVEIREIAGGYRMATKPECHDAVRLFVKSLKPAMKLSLPALETLAVIAYKQPVTAPEVNEIRGVESAGVLGSLLARKLIATAGRKPVIGRPILYKTTKEFLLRFGLKDVAELPSMEEFEKMAAIEMEEEMEPEVVAADAAEDAAEIAQDDENPDEANSHPAASDTEAVSNAYSTAVTAAGDQAIHNPSESAPAEPDSTPQAETETHPDAQEIQEGR